MIYRLAGRALGKTVFAVGAASLATSYTLSSTRPTLSLDGPLDRVKEAAGDVKDKLASVSPLKPQSPAGIPGAKTSHNPSTSMNHGQTAGESDAEQADPLVSAQKKRQKASGNKTDNDEKEQTAKRGGGAGAKIKSGHSLDGEGKRVPNHDGIKSSNQPKKEPSSSGGAGAKAGPLSGAVASGMEEKEEEATKEEAFNEETGEINWDCPCLGGMAHGPCGEDFKSAFSCFVYSKEEPKGKECLEQFQQMQACFKKHEDIYGQLTEDSETPEGKVVD